jgi:hypothetical protein
MAFQRPCRDAKDFGGLIGELVSNQTYLFFVFKSQLHVVARI